MLRRILDTLRLTALYAAVLGGAISGTTGSPEALVTCLQVWAVLEVLAICAGPAPAEPSQSFSAARLARRERDQSACAASAAGT